MQVAADTSIVDELRLLRALHEQTTTGLRGQQHLLKIRDLSLPLEALDLLASIDDQIATLERTLDNDYTELAQLRVLIETSALINTSFDLDQILEQSMDVIIQLTGAERGYILLSNPDTGEVEFRISREPSAVKSAGDDVSTTIIESVLQTGKPLVTDNASSDPRMVGSETIARFTLRSIICAPLIYKETVTGAIYVDNRMKEAVFTEREMNLLVAFANQTAVAIENAHLFANVQGTLAEITRVKELLENVFASIVSGVITTGADDHILTFNRAATNILATPAEYVIGHPVQVLYPEIGDLDQSLHGVLKSSQPTALETQATVPGRGAVTLSLKISPLRNAAQQIQGAAMLMDDLTEQREREEAAQILQRYLPPGMMENIEQIARLDLGGERREVTSMFIFACPYDLQGTGRPEQLMAVLNQYLEVATNVVHHARGIIDKYMGNEIMVLVNTQLNPMPDHSLQSVLMALELRDAFVQLYERLGVDPGDHEYRVGIHTGVATLGNVGSLNRRSFTAIGDAINLSKRLQENAKPGQIIISEDTLHHVLQQGSRTQLMNIRFDELESLQVKGRQQLTRIYEVHRGSSNS